MIVGEAQLTADDKSNDQGGGSDLAQGTVWALGLMSGTSMDGIDAALIRTDGLTIAEIGPALTRPYDGPTRAALGEAVAEATTDQATIADVARAITDAHGAAVAALLAEWRAEDGGGDGGDAIPAVIGFHGHTLWHRPEEGKTCQIGDGARLAAAAGIPVIDDFRAADMAAGGQGAPFAPLYHAARLKGSGVGLPVAILNLGGVANVTWINGDGDGDEGTADDGGLLAFDTGPASALIDDWVREKTGRPFDEGGALAVSGQVDEDALARLMDDPYFAAPPPKSLDRRDFEPAPVAALNTVDGAATLCAFTAAAIGRASQFLPAAPKAWFATGGGRHNGTLMAAIGAALGTDIRPVEDLGWNGDGLEAEAFAFLAVRSLKGLPLSLPGTTGVAKPTTGGVLHRP
jgi:anhydro-N-acetylmuramic acid kinase